MWTPKANTFPKSPVKNHPPVNVKQLARFRLPLGVEGQGGPIPRGEPASAGALSLTRPGGPDDLRQDPRFGHWRRAAGPNLLAPARIRASSGGDRTAATAARGSGAGTPRAPAPEPHGGGAAALGHPPPPGKARELPHLSQPHHVPGYFPSLRPRGPGGDVSGRDAGWANPGAETSDWNPSPASASLVRLRGTRCRLHRLRRRRRRRSKSADTRQLP